VEKYINDYGKECYQGVDENDKFSELEFHAVKRESGERLVYSEEPDTQFALHTNLGTFTVLDRMTGFGHRDTETGFRAPDGKFWLASGDYDVRHSGASTISDAIEWVKKRARFCPVQTLVIFRSPQLSEAKMITAIWQNGEEYRDSNGYPSSRYYAPQETDFETEDELLQWEKLQYDQLQSGDLFHVIFAAEIVRKIEI
jgi:hypothetical protein